MKFTAFSETGRESIRRSGAAAGGLAAAHTIHFDPHRDTMNTRNQFAAGLLILTALSHSVTASAEVAPAACNSGLELNSKAVDPLPEGGEWIEFTVTGGAALRAGWMLAADSTAELVAVRARLEGRIGVLAPTGDHELLPIRFDEEGAWIHSTPRAWLRTWYQAITLDSAGGFVFSDLTRGARNLQGSQNSQSYSTAPTKGISPQSVGGLYQDGFVVITEIMKDPAQVSDAAGEWFEVYNAGPHRADLERSLISDDGTNAHVIYTGGAGMWVLPGKRLVFGRNADATLNGGVTLDYEYSGFTLSNGSDQIMLTGRDGVLQDRVAYDDGIVWPDTSGMSISLTPGAEDPYLNDDGANWCHGSTLIASGSSDSGTPGSLNDVCP